jgi:hypothetical protein
MKNQHVRVLESRGWSPVWLVLLPAIMFGSVIALGRVPTLDESQKATELGPRASRNIWRLGTIICRCSSGICLDVFNGSKELGGYE